jgi:pimeloyl-ACP methyl ester carboxylesterase
MSTLFLHGFTGSPAAWDEVGLPGVRETLVGHGVDGGGTWREEVDRLAERIPPHSHVVGYSMGARVALGILVAHPDRVARATLIAAHAGLRTEAERRARVAEEAGWHALLARGIAPFVDAWQVRFPGRRETRLRHDPAGLARALRAIGLAAMPDLWPALAAVRVPVTLVAGARDAKFCALADRLASAIPGARVRIVADCGHDVTLDAPTVLAKEITS